MPVVPAAGSSGGILARHWDLDPELHHLNHGSFGACPREVLAAQMCFRGQLERDPMGFFLRELPRLADAATEKLAAFVGAGPADLAFVPNATSGVNTILRALAFRAGDEILTTDHEYNACRNALDYVAARSGAAVVTANLPFPLETPGQILDTILDRVTPRTRLALIDHVTSPSALVLPIEHIVAQLNARGVDTLVDGAHGPGMLALNLSRLGAAYYTGNCHKWLSTPKGAALLYVRPDRQRGIRPLVISHGANSPLQDRSRYQTEFAWTGTHDPTPYLSVPAALDFMAGLLPGGWMALRDHNRRLAIAGRREVCRALDLAPPCPETMLGSMAAIVLASGSAATAPASATSQDALELALFERYRISVPIIRWPHPPRLIVRLSAQIYNRPEQYRLLGRALRELLPRA